MPREPTAVHSPTVPGPLPWRALLQSGQTLEAELPLRQAAAMGDLEAEVEFGGWLRLTGQPEAARRSLERSLHALDDPDSDLSRLAERYRSQALFDSGEVAQAIELAQVLTRSGDRRAALVLAQMHLELGELASAGELFRQVLDAPDSDPGAALHLTAWCGLSTAQARSGQTEQAADSLRRAQAWPQGADPWAEAHRRRAAAELALWSGKREAALEVLRDLSALAEPLQDAELWRWNVATQAELLGEQGQFGDALRLLYHLGTRQGLPPPLQVVRGLLMRRQRHERLALADLSEGCAALKPQDQLLFWRGQLYLADLWRRLEPAAAAPIAAGLLPVLAHLGSAQDFHVYAADLRELCELVEYALIEPSLAAQMQRVLACFHGLPAARAAPMMLEVQTLGHVSVRVNGGMAETLSAGAVLLLTYLQLHPGRSRNEMQAMLFPDFGRPQTTAFFRTAVRELRARLGADILHLDDTRRHPRYRLGRNVDLKLDLTALREILSCAAPGPADLEHAASLYDGPFFADLHPESEWVHQVRAEVRWAMQLAFERAAGQVRTGEETGRLRHLLAQIIHSDGAVADTAGQLAQALDQAHRRTLPT